MLQNIGELSIGRRGLSPIYKFLSEPLCHIFVSRSERHLKLRPQRALKKLQALLQQLQQLQQHNPQHHRQLNQGRFRTK